jgi:hypothetical protein
VREQDTKIKQLYYGNLKNFIRTILFIHNPIFLSRVAYEKGVNTIKAKTIIMILRRLGNKAKIAKKIEQYLPPPLSM